MVNNKNIGTRAITFLTKNGPSTQKALSQSLRTSHGRLNPILGGLKEEGKLDQLPRGQHRGQTVYMWAIKGDSRVQARVGPRVSFGGAEVLLAMQAAARSRLMEHRA